MTATDQSAARALVELRLRRRRAEAARRNTIEPIPREGFLPVSPLQRNQWLLHQLNEGSATYHVPFALRLRGTLDLPALREAMRALVERHESLRTTFHAEHGAPYQVIAPPPAAWELPVTDVTPDGLRDWADAAVRRSFDLATGPLMRTGLARLSDTEHVLVLVMHHIITDGWSVGLMARDLTALYEGRQLPALRIQPVDHAAWQSRAGRETLEKKLDYWTTRLADLPELDFPADRARPADPAGTGAVLRRPLDPAVVAAVRELVGTTRTSLLAVLQAGFVTVLSRWTGQPDVVVGSVLSGRTRAETEALAGFFANSTVLRVGLAGDPAFTEVVQRCSESVLGALEHQDVPFGAVVEALKPSRVPGRNPLFQISFTLLTNAILDEFRLGDLVVEPVPVDNGTARFDIAFQVDEAADGSLSVWLEYSTELFDEDRMERLIRHFERALELGTADPQARVATLPLLSPAEWDEIQGWNPSPVVRDGSLLLHDLVAGWDAGSVAVTHDGGRSLTYGELHAASDSVAAALQRELGVRPGSVVGILLDRGPDLPVAQLGILKAGAAWLPLDPQQPPARWQAQLDDAGAVGVITGSDLPLDVPRLRLDGVPAGAPEPVEISPDDIAYVIYTSGSTGKPKGVMIPHRAASHFVLNARELFSLRPGDRLLQFANPAFDVSVFDIFAALGSGATVATAARETLLDPDQLQDLMQRTGVTVTDLPPAVLRLLDPAPLTSLRALFVGLEAFPAELVNRWVSPTREFHNGYGPTEATVACVDYRCPADGVTQSPPIGRAMPNHRVYVLDSNFQPVPVGVPGELFIAGAGLARGYVNRPDLTAERFLPDPFTGERMYRTGDVVRWRTDGDLEFLGRRDRQVKIRGLRIELAEVEHALSACDGVRQAVVTVDQPGTPQASLIGYVVGTADGVRERLMQRLPLHMVPAQVIAIDELPLTPNGKLDHARLPSPGSVVQEHQPPRTDSEKALAGIWHELLGVPLDKIGVLDSFFDLGGNSLQATRLIARIRDAVQVAIEPRTLFARPVLAELAAEIDAEHDRAASADEALEEEIAGLSEEELDRLLNEEAR